jgi:putative nucleotidyltransferase with HDIG domain
MTTMTIDNRVKQIISNIRNLPTPPIVFHQIQKVMADPRASAGQIASILGEDPAMSVKVLKLTNSAFYGLAREVESVKQAVVIVGMEAIKNLVLSASVLDMFKGHDFDQEYQEKFWRHSLAVAFCGRLLARKVRTRATVDPDSAFSGGLLHDIGKMVMCCFLKKEWKDVMAERDKDLQAATFEIEERTVGYDHAQVGAILAEQWKLPHRLSEAITYHHHPELTESEEAVPHYINLANYIAKKTFYDRDEAHLIDTPSLAALEKAGLTEEELDEYGEALREEYTKAETFMKMAGIG